MKREPYLFFFVPGILALPGLILVPYFIIDKFSRRGKWHFTRTEFIETRFFGSKKIFRRNQMKSVFINETQFTRNGFVSSKGYSVVLRIPDYKISKGSYAIISIENDDVANQHVNRIGFNNVFGANNEALTIAEIISEHWNIPLSV